MNDTVKELYRMLLIQKWVVIDQRDVDKVRIVMVSNRRPNKANSGIVSRGGQKLRGTHSYPTKIYYFNTSNGEATALTMADVHTMEHMEFLDNLVKKVNTTDVDHIVTGEVLL